MMTVEAASTLGAVLDRRPALSKDNLVEPVGDLYQRVHLLETIHYRWVPIGLGVLLAGWLIFRKRQ